MLFKSILTDMRSGIVVFLVALPLCLGVALACGAPLFSGIMSGIIGGSIVALLSGSQLSVSGPSPAITAILISSVALLGSYQAFIAVLLVAGVFQFMLGFFRAGSISSFIPNAVIKGMLAGIGIILIIKQVPHLVGFDKDPEGDFFFDQPDGHNTFSDLFYMINYITPGTTIIGIVSLLILVVAGRPFYQRNKFLSLLPGPLLAVIAGILLNLAFSSSPSLSISAEHTVNFPGINSWAQFKSNFPAPDFSQAGKVPFWTTALVITVVVSLESLLTIEATDRLDPEKRSTNPNRELMAQGIGNALAGFLGALPVTAVIVRSSANIQAGAKTKFSALFHALLLLCAVLFIPGILALIPNAALAAILIVTGYKLAKISFFTEQLKKGIDQFLPFMITIVVMLLTDLLRGICAGLVVSVIFIIRDNIRRSFDVGQDFIDGRMHYLIKFPQHITFFNKGFMVAYFNGIARGSKVIIDGSMNKTTDKDAEEVIADFLDSKYLKNLEIEIINYKPLTHDK